MKHIQVVIVASMLVFYAMQTMAGGDPAAGKEKSKPCQACHGVDGNSPSPNFPRLDGQYADYIVRSLKDYKTGARKNPVMAGFAANLTQQDREDLAAYYANQDDGLYVPGHKP